MWTHRAVTSCILSAGLGLALACGAAFAGEPNASAAKSSPAMVVFVCTHGSVKSLAAAQRFNRLAELRGLNVRAVSRAANNEVKHEKVPEEVLYQLSLEGYDVTKISDPRALTPQEAASAVRVVEITLKPEDTKADPMARAAAAAAEDHAERWDDIPTMIQNWHQARGVLLPRVDAMIDEFAKHPEFAGKPVTAAAK